MKIKRRTKIISETERTYSFFVRRRAVSFFCPACGSRAEMFSINEAARRSGSPWRELVRMIESGSLHSAETDNGEIYVCGVSLCKKNRTAK